MLQYPKDCDEFFKIEIAPNFWLMDRHKWTFYAWVKNKSKLHNVLLHLDYHWDANNDFRHNPELSEKLKSCSLGDIKEFIQKGHIKHDSFIAPAVIANIFNEIHFLCYQKDADVGLYDDFLKQYNAIQIIHRDIDSVVKALNNKRIAFDLDLDIFNKSEVYLTGDLWKEKDIIQFINKCEPLLKNADIITVAMSYGHSGTKQDTQHLTDLVVEQIKSYL